MPYVALSKSAAQSLIEDHSKVIEYYSNDGKYSVEGIRNSLKQQLKQVEDLSLQIYAKLGYSGGTLQAVEDKFNQNLLKARSDTAPLSGASLDKIFLSALKRATAYVESQQDEYDAFLAFLENKVITEKGAGIQNFEGEVATEMFKIIGKNISGTLLVSSTTGKTRYAKGGKFSGYKFSRAFTNLSKNIQTEVLQYIQEHKASIKLNSNVSSDDSLQMEWLVENIDINSFFRMKEHERTILFNKYPELLSILNQSFKQEIQQHCNGANQNYLSRAIDKVIYKKGGELAFFVGGNIKGMTGILGEIQALYFLLFITNGKIDSDLGWIGGINNPHSDLILRDGLSNFGIQVKNSSLEGAEQEIEFQSFNTTGVGAQYLKGGYLGFDNTANALSELDKLAPYDLFNAVETLLAMEVFNVEYQWSNGTAYEADNEEFSNERQLIEFYSQKAQQIMQLFSASMLYMQTNSLSNKQSNILYFIGGGIVKSAGTILKRIIFELDSKLHSFKMTMKNKGTVGETQKTIVDYLNAEKGHHNLHFTFQSSFNF